MSNVPSNLIPTRITQLPEAPNASADGYLVFVYQGRTYKIRAGDIVFNTIPDGSITEVKLADSAVSEVKILDGAVSSVKLASSSVVSTKIEDGAVVTAKLADDAVTAAKIADGAVTSAKLGDGSVTADRIGSNAVTEIKIQSDAVTSDKIKTLSVTTDKLADKAVTSAKLSLTYARDGDNSDITSLTGVTRVGFNTTVDTPSHTEGRLFYDNTTKSLAYYNEDANVTVNLGREELVRVFNNTGSVILNGKAVYINGASGGWPTVTLAQANTSVGSQSMLGIVTADIGIGAHGYVCVSGVVNDVNTNAYAAGTRLYLSSTSAGDWTSTPPLQPNYVVEIATVVSQNATTGKLFIHVDKQNWFPYAEIRDTTASITLPTTPTIFKATTTVANDGFSYDNTTGVLTFNVSGSYSVSIQFNALPSASNKNVYFYAEDSSDGVTWTITQYSARQILLPNASETQINITAARYYKTGTRLRFNVWGDATVSLVTSNLPGTTPGTVTKPAYRFLIA